MSGAMLTYTHHHEEYTFELGKPHHVRQEDGDIVIERAVASDCPVTVKFLLRPSGQLDYWYADFDGNDNQYWHFSEGFSGDISANDVLKDAIARLRDNKDIYGNLGGNMGADIIRWAFGEDAVK